MNMALLKSILSSLLLFALLAASPSARADVETGISWLAARETATGVHRESDIALAAESNGEAWLTLARLQRVSTFDELTAVARADAGDSQADAARQAMIRLQSGQTASSTLDQLIASQNSDGGVPAFAGLQSEALTTALTVVALDRAGRGGTTAAARMIGYLISAQQTDGGWLAAAPNASSVFISAQIVTALVPYRSRFELTTTLNRAGTFLRNARGTSNTYGSIFETALAVDALIALRANRTELEPIVTELAAQQAPSGAFADDAYQTALALRALHAFATPDVPPSRAALRGRVLAADTDLPISGAQLALTGGASITINSNDTGLLVGNDLAAGSFSAVLSYPGMRSVEFSLTLIEGRTLDLGDIRMYQASGPVGNFGLIRGTVRNAETQAPIAGASVRIEAPPTTVSTDADGRYQFLQVPVGPVRLIASASGFASASASTNVVSQSIIEFSPNLEPIPNPPPGALIRGRVVHGQTDAPLPNVTIAVTAGAPAVSVQSNANGEYELPVQPGDALTVQASLTDFDSVSITAPLAQGEVLNFSPRLYPTGQTPVGSNTTLIKGVVVNQANRRPIANALIVVSDPAGQQSLRSDDEGRFSITQINGPITGLAFSADAFEPTTLAVSVRPLEQRDVGTVGLKPTTVSFYFPDLVIVDSSLATTDADNFALDQSFRLDVANRGTSSLTQDFTLIAFVDANGNAVHDVALEPVIGTVRVDDDLLVGDHAEVDIAVRAQMSFRDAPIAFVVDAEREVPEQDEDNNVASSLLGCRVTPSFIGDDGVRVKWHWRGLSSNPQINSLNQTPTVAQFSDDNGDGVINEYDIPDVAFVAGRRASINPSQTALVVLSGDDGRELWSRTDLNLSHFTSIAVGDLDNDAIAELVVVRGYRQELIALEHTGVVKWRRALDGPGIPVPLIPPPPFVYDQPVIANLEGDNEAEVILGREAFRGLNGEQLWEGEFDAGGHNGGKPLTAPLAKANGIGSIAADVNLDGVLEVIAGRTLYDFEGRTLWHRADINPEVYADAVHTPMSTSGLNAVGNFDLDDFAEIVLTSGDQLWLLDHLGQTIWGPKYAPDFGELGAPSVADLDSDGLPEIMISSNERLTIFESDGTVKWTAEIHDESGVTSATIFDFENDGLYEVVHMDEEDFRIYDALTGTRLYETRNTSVTVYEYPVIADVDGDKQADIILNGYDEDLVAGVTPGIRVLEARNGAWADAGAVWGSHAFHINDINEDSTVPLLETPSWLTHNTYRVQRSPLPDPLGMPDFSIGDLRLVDQGPGRNPVVQMRIGNAGPVDAHEPPYVSIYRGDPAQGGVLLKETRLDTLRPARFQIVDLGEVALTGSGDLYAVLDVREKANECREENNQRVVPFSASNGRGTLQVRTDKLAYRTAEDPVLTAAVTNVGGLPADFSVRWSIRDSGNRQTSSLPEQPFANILPAGDASRDYVWAAADTLAGTYSLVATLHDASGEQVDQASAVFTIAGDFAGPAGNLILVSDQASYAPGQAINLTFRAQNLSATESIRLPEVEITATGPSGYTQTRRFALNDLPIESLIDGQDQLDGADAPGTYQVNARLRSRLTGFEYATATVTVQRLDDPTADLRGDVQVQRPTLLVGESQTCLFAARNLGTRSLPNQTLRKRMVALDQGTIVHDISAQTALAAGAEYLSSEQLSTSGLTAGDYACVLDAANGAEWRLLASEPFTLNGQPPAEIVVDPTTGLTTSEAGSSASFLIRLSRAPTADVSIPLQIADTSEWQLSTSLVTFTPSNWNLPRTVTVIGVDDTEVDGDIDGQVLVQPASSADPDYQGIDPSDVTLTNIDNDSVSIQVSPARIDTSESGSVATVQIRLNAAPTAPVQIGLSTSDASEWLLSGDSVVFDASNWQQPLSVDVQGVDDNELDGTVAGSIVTAVAQSADLRFDGLDPADVEAFNADNDTAQILVAPTSIITSEGGPAQTVTVSLGAAPNAAVVIPIGAVDSSEWRVQATEITLDASNWQTGVPLVIEPVDDNELDGDQSMVLALGLATSQDSRYQGLNPTDIDLTNRDNEADLVSIIVSPTSGLIVDENGGTASFQIALSHAPTATVRVDLSSSDATEFALAPDFVEFTPTDHTPRNVQVLGIDDNDADGNIAGFIQTASATSADSRYQGINPENVGVSNIDNETVQITLGPLTGVETTEAGSTASITLRASVVPTAPVTVRFANPDTSEWQLSSNELVLTPANGTAPIALTVTGVDDFDLDGDITATLISAPAESTDARFADLNPVDALLTNLDDDLPAALQVTPNTVSVSEDGSNATVSVRLSTMPSATVRVPVQNPDAGEFQLDRNELVFEPADWQQPQTFTVTGVDDTDVDGTVNATIALQSAISTDVRFAGLDPTDVAAANADNDSLAPAELLIQGMDLQTSEAGDGGRITVALNRAPLSPVDIEISTDDAGSELGLSTAQLRFTAADAITPKDVLLTGRDDLIDDGDRSITLTIRVLPGSDPDFAGLTPSPLIVTNADDDAAGVSLSLVGPNEIREGEGTEFRVRLESQPTAPVSLRLQAARRDPAGTTSLQFDPAEVALDARTWQTGTSVWLVTQDNRVVDPEQIVDIDALVSTTADPSYPALRSNSLAVTILDVGGSTAATPVPIDRHAWYWLICLIVLLTGAHLRSRRGVL